jgi:SAM-dependent methyltransferase
MASSISAKLKSIYSKVSNPRGKRMLTYARPRRVTDLKDCYFYHTMELPTFGEIIGEWDLRGEEAGYTGSVELKGKRVLEIGTASGHLCFWMERQGAEVVGFDLDEHQDWDLVPAAGSGHETAAQRREHIRKMNNAWWLSHREFQSRARVAYGSVYKLDDSLGLFDIVTINSVLLHLRDPALAIQRAAALAKEKIVITDVSEDQFLHSRPHMKDELALYFIPRVGGPTDSWWYVPSALVMEYLRIVGFSITSKTQHEQRLRGGHRWQFYTIVAQRN